MIYDTSEKMVWPSLVLFPLPFNLTHIVGGGRTVRGSLKELQGWGHIMMVVTRQETRERHPRQNR